jgi:ABC-type uncharacterized transport system ATPase subunit
VGERQRVEIIKALYRGADMLILDEPTAVLTPQEVDDLFVTLRPHEAGRARLIFISHKLREVLAISDRITVLRGGRALVARAQPGRHPGELARMMVGREVLLERTRTCRWSWVRCSWPCTASARWASPGSRRCVM